MTDLRDLLESERIDLYAGRCPHCRGERLTPGPRGAAAQNFECADCGAAYNRIAPEYVEKYSMGEKVPPFGQQIRPPRS